MAIVNYTYYNTTYMGEPIAESEFPRAEARAERAIAQITFGRSANYADLPDFQQEAVRNAVCAQVEYYALMGTDISVNGEAASGWAVGKVRVDAGASGSKTGAASMVCAAAIATLEQTGLLNPQVATVGNPPQVWGWWL